MNRFLTLCAIGLVAIAATGQAARADSFAVSVGYADNLRPNPFFPTPWMGSPNVLFEGAANGTQFDSGAVRLDNTGATPLNVTALTVDGLGDGSVYHIWGSFFPLTLAPGKMAIFTQTSGFNFDTSDNQDSHPAAEPVVHFTIGGQTFDFTDTAQVINTEGTDHLAQADTSESHQWRPIGTFGGQAGTPVVPEPGSLSLLLFGGLPLLGLLRRRSG